jgi:hypothetical protein
MKHFLLLTLFCSLSALCAETATESLINVIRNGNTYKIDVANRRCPTIIQLEHDTYADPNKLEKGDIPFHIRGFEKKEGRIIYGEFTHENENFNFRPSIKEGKNQTLERNCAFVLGFACRFAYQTTEKDSILFEGSAKILSIAMIDSLNVNFKFNSTTNSFSYILKSKGIDDVVCNYGSAPELKNDIASYLQEKKAEEATMSQPRNVDNSNRSNRKEPAINNDHAVKNHSTLK